jgi:hypothetical protein
MRSTEGEIPTLADEQMLREAGNRGRRWRGNGRFIRRKLRAGQGSGECEDGPFMTDVAGSQHGMLRHEAENEPQIHTAEHR